MIIRLILNALIFLFTAYLFGEIGLSFSIESFWWALLAAIILGTLNLFIKPFLHLISLPITILTLGLFSLIINGLLFWLMVLILRPHIDIPNFWVAVLAALVYTIFSSLLAKILKK
jgi:putative membrane protein